MALVPSEPLQKGATVGELGVFEADANAGKLSAEARAEQGFDLERDVDRAIFRAKEMFGSYLANAESKSDLEERWLGIKPQVIKVIAEVTTPTPGVIQRVGRSLNPSLSSRAARKTRPSSAKTASEKERREYANAHRDEIVSGSGVAIEPKNFTHVGSTQKHAWAYDQATKLYTSKDPMQKFACPGCGNEQEHLGFTHCAGCNRTWNSWPVRRASSGKTSASTYVLMAREIKMRGDQFKLASNGEVEIIGETQALTADLSKVADAPIPQEPPPGMSQPSMSGMPGDNSGAMSAPMPPEQPPTPGGDSDGDADIAGGVTEDSPIDQIQDALQDAIVALKDVQMLSINPALAVTASVKSQKVSTLRSSMDRFWALHKQMNYVAGMLAKEASEAIRTTDPRITGENEFIRGYHAAAENKPLPEKTGRAWLEGYVAFHKQGETYSDGANYNQVFNPDPGDDKSPGARNDGTFLDGSGLVPANEIRGDSGSFDASQPASQESARRIDEDSAAGSSRNTGQGDSSTIQPTGSRRALPKGKK